MGITPTAPFLFKRMTKKKNKGAKLVADAIIGLDVRTCIVGGKVYVIHPPTIKKLAGAAHYLDGIANADSVHAVLCNQANIENIAHAFSWIVNGDDSLFEQVAHGAFDELVEGIELAYSMLSPQGFLKLSHLAKNVAMMIAQPKW